MNENLTVRRAAQQQRYTDRAMRQSAPTLTAGIWDGMAPAMAKHPTTRSIDLTGQAVEEKEARKELRRCQLELLQLQTDLRDKQNMAVVVVFEGMDAAGKGGAIRRLTGKLDPRGFVVHPIGAPDVVEKAHHYLWRFQMRMPRRGQIAIFDRSWYGRVLVERIEGFCTEREWKRAYREICDFERILVDNGQVLIKFWLHVSKQEQLRRFRAREGDPFKEYKITDEDWRNRRQWSAYIAAADEMFRKTHSARAPWHAISGEDKWQARLAVVRTVTAALRRHR